ncbi:enoyl-CoA hydratase/isomerase family protein [Nocardioides sp. J54]|uniref:enoyl-CoA hydratase/isomerase family protein n=1 Tax=Nocardioides sp. J54 TaxID=935866 RepID=UPI0004B82E1A|nr:enoyl-CoA hydratase/isomerase family protein [Nocardioides sp. J54]
MANVHLSVDDGVATLTFDNPGRKNAITPEMAAAAVAHCDAIERDESVGAVVVRAEGDYFCSGADTRSLAAASRNPASSEAVATISAVYDVFGRIAQLPVPTVSVVVGGAVGAGMNLALAADVLLTTEDAVFDSGFLARRIHPGGGHISLLGRAVGRPTAAAMVLLGQPLTGRRMHELGWAFRCAPREELDDLAREVVAVAAQDPVLTRRVKSSLQLELGAPVGWAQALEVERGAQMWSMARKGEDAWNSRGPARAATTA